jgi:hypothetical protein
VLQDSAPWGYLRADGVDAVLYVDGNRRVHEITRVGATSIDLDYGIAPINAPMAAGGQFNGPVPDVIGYVRADNRSAVVYRDTNSHVIEILHNPGGNPSWVVYDLTSLSGAQVVVAKGSAFPYARSDGYNTIVYAANDAQIHELAAFNTTGPGSGAWGDYSLSVVTGTFTGPSSDPWGYRRSDGWNCVVYIGDDNKLHELAFYPGSGWSHGILPAVSPWSGLHRRPSGYIRGDGLNAVVYLGTDGLIHELLLSGGWTDSILPMPNSIVQVSQLFGHRASGSRSSVLFRALDLGDWKGFELSKPLAGSWGLQGF